MNLVEIATLIQNGIKEYNKNYSSEVKERWIPKCRKEVVLYYVMKETKGHMNPKIISDLIDLETSIPDHTGMTQC